MNAVEAKSYIKNAMNMDGLINVLGAINEWKRGPYELGVNNYLRQLAEDLRFEGDTRELEEIVLEVAHEKLHEIVLLLVKDRPGEYFK